MNVDVAIPARLSVDVTADVPIVAWPPGAHRPYPQTILPTQGAAGTTVTIFGFQFVGTAGVTFVRLGPVIHTATNGANLTVIDDERLTFVTLPGQTGVQLDVIVGPSTFGHDAGILLAAWRNL